MSNCPHILFHPLRHSTWNLLSTNLDFLSKPTKLKGKYSPTLFTDLVHKVDVFCFNMGLLLTFV